MFWTASFVIVAGLVAVRSQSTCQDIDTSACVLLAQQQDICSNNAIAESACKRYCKLCRIECYQCTDSLLDPGQCNTTQLCQPGELCMRKELNSIVDGHHEYQMSCESKAACDGNGLSISFVGKRDINERDVSVSCCSDDLCNYPQMMTKTTTTKLPITTIVNNQGCKKDVIIIVDESRSMLKSETAIKTLLSNLVSNLRIGADASLVSMATFAANVVDRWDLDAYTNERDLLKAIKGVQFKGGVGDNTVALSYLVNKATTQKAGDRLNVPDTILLITDDISHSRFQTQLLTTALDRKSNDIITIGLGQAATTSEIDQIATDTGHSFHVRSSSSLPNLLPKLLNLVCQ